MSGVFGESAIINLCNRVENTITEAESAMKCADIVSRVKTVRHQFQRITDTVCDNARGVGEQYFKEAADEMVQINKEIVFLLE